MELIRSNFDGRRFHYPVPREHGWGALLRWMFSRQPGRWPKWTAAPPAPPPPNSSQELRVTFVNHTTFLLQLDGVNILTDPIWSERAGPFSWIGPRRHTPPGIRFENLPPIHLVLLSHDHYDHMDIPTLQRLAREHHPAIYAGLRNGHTLAKHGIGNVIELDWWNKVASPQGIRITAVPARHFSGRSPFNRDQTLWCGFVIEGQAATICFAGDTGTGPHFQQIAQQFPSIDLAVLPIGAFRPRWFMCEVHMSPDDAVQAHLQLGAQTSVPCHFGTFRLADDGQDEPVKRLREALEQANLDGTEFWVLALGEGRALPAKVAPRAADGKAKLAI